MASIGDYRHIAHGLLAYQRRGQFIDTAFESSLGIAETHILVELAVDPQVKFEDIGKRFSLGKSSISRKVAYLQEEGYVTARPSATDRRRKEYGITKKAEEFLDLLDRRNAEVLADYTSRVTVEEVAEVQRYLKKLADGAGVPDAVLRSQENPLLAQIRRISGVFSIFGNSFSGSGYTNREWQVFSLLAYSPYPLRAADVCEQLIIPPNTASQLFVRHENAGNIARSVQDDDKRNLTVALTSSGKGVLRHIENSMIKIIKRALSDCSTEEVKRFGELLARYSGLESSQEGTTIEPRTEIVPIRNEDERDRARAFVVFHMVREGIYNLVRETVVGERSVTFGLKRGERFVAICEFQGIGKEALLAHLAYAPEIDSSDLLSIFLKKAAEGLSQERPRVKSLLIPDALLNSTSIAIPGGDSISSQQRAFPLKEFGHLLQRKVA